MIYEFQIFFKLNFFFLLLVKRHTQSTVIVFNFSFFFFLKKKVNLLNNFYCNIFFFFCIRIFIILKPFFFQYKLNIKFYKQFVYRSTVYMYIYPHFFTKLKIFT
jgi:hypothetical protein